MPTVLNPPDVSVRLPDHLELPCEDGTFVTNFTEHPQSILLTTSIAPVLQNLHPDGRYCIGQNCGVYWNHTDPPLEGARAPDWFCVEDVPALLNGRIRRSYVMWNELIPPTILLEFASGDGTEELDNTPWEGKFWIYERAVHAPYYAVWIPEEGQLQVYRLLDGRYVRMTPNEHGRYLIVPWGVELGLWQGSYLNLEAQWLRWWDTSGNMLLTGEEQAELERQQKEQAQRAAEEAQRAAEEAQRAAELERQQRERLAEKLRALGIDPDAE